MSKGQYLHVDRESTEDKLYRIIPLLREFLSSPRLSEGGGWAPVEDQDLTGLTDLLFVILESKFGADANGDLPISFRLIDRNKFKNDFYFPVPYENDDNANLDYIMEVMIANLERATGQLDRLLQLRRMVKRLEAEKQAGKTQKKIPKD